LPQNLATILNLNTSKMAGNKFNTQFAIHKPAFYSLTFKDLYDEERTITGTPKQIINYILNQQL
jgi:hypothetical protein